MPAITEAAEAASGTLTDDALPERRLVLWLLYAFFLFYALLTFWLYQDRLVADTAQYLFNVITTGRLYLVNSRWSPGIAQCFPLLGLWIGVSLNGLIRLYSIAFAIEYFALFLILAHGLRDLSMAIALAVLLTCDAAHLFFWPMTEIQQSLAWCLLLYSILRKSNGESAISFSFHALKGFAAPLATLLVILFFHPLAAIYAFYAIALDALHRGRPRLHHYLLGGFSGLFFLVRNLTASEFEKSRMKALAGNIFNGPYLGSMQRTLLLEHTSVLLMLAALTVVCVVRRERLKIAFVWAWYVGYLFFMNVTNQPEKGWFPVFYDQHLYLPLTYFVCVPFVEWAVSEKNRRIRWSAVGATLVLIAFHAALIIPARRDYQNRHEAILRLMRSEAGGGHRHLVIGEGNLNYRLIDFAVEFPFESLLLSATSSDLRPMTITLQYDTETQPTTPRSMKSVYFNLPAGPLTFLNTPAKLSHFDATFIRNIGLVPHVTSPVRPGSQCSARVVIRNANNEPIPSGLKGECKAFLSYHWLRDGKMVIWEGERTALERDVVGSYEQPITIKAPEEAGKYTLCVDIILENLRWLEIKGWQEVVVE